MVDFSGLALCWRRPVLLCRFETMMKSQKSTNRIQQQATLRDIESLSTSLNRRSENVRAHPSTIAEIMSRNMGLSRA
jgi:hypothetical protein